MQKKHIFFITFTFFCLGSQGIASTMGVASPKGTDSPKMVAPKKKGEASQKLRDCGSASVYCYDKNENLIGNLVSSWTSTDRFDMCWDSSAHFIGECAPCQYKGWKDADIKTALDAQCNAPKGCYNNGTLFQCCTGNCVSSW